MAKMVAREVGCSRGQAFLASAAEARGCSRPGPPLHTCSGPHKLAKPSAGTIGEAEQRRGDVGSGRGECEWSLPHRGGLEIE